MSREQKSTNSFHSSSPSLYRPQSTSPISKNSNKQLEKILVKSRISKYSFSIKKKIDNANQYKNLTDFVNKSTQSARKSVKDQPSDIQPFTKLKRRVSPVQKTQGNIALSFFSTFFFCEASEIFSYKEDKIFIQLCPIEEYAKENSCIKCGEKFGLFRSSYNW